MKFIVHEKSTINNSLNVGVLGIFTSLSKATSAINDKRIQMSEMFGVDEDSVYNTESLKPFYFKDTNGVKASWRIDKQD